MLRVDYTKEIGMVYTNYGEDPMEIGIYGANALCAFVQRGVINAKGEKTDMLINFYADEKHIKNQIKAHGDLYITGGDITSIHLNAYYKEAWTLAKYFAREGIMVVLWYKEPKTK